LGIFPVLSHQDLVNHQHYSPPGQITATSHVTLKGSCGREIPSREIKVGEMIWPDVPKLHFLIPVISFHGRNHLFSSRKSDDEFFGVKRQLN